jgi:hypothetical protein
VREEGAEAEAEGKEEEEEAKGGIRSVCVPMVTAVEVREGIEGGGGGGG